jgi:ribosomal protein S21
LEFTLSKSIDLGHNMTIARVRVELKPARFADKAFKAMFKEFKRKCGEAAIQHTYKEHQYFESKPSKARKKHRECVNKMQQELIEQKLERGEKVRCSSKLIKKIRAKQAKADRRFKIADGKVSEEI